MVLSISILSKRALRMYAVIAWMVFSVGVSADDSGYPVRVVAVEKQPITRTVSTYGVLAPKIEDLSFRVRGRIEEFHVVEGQTVSEGDLLAQLETRDAEDALNQARVSLDQAKRQFERFEKLAADRLIQASQLDQARDQLKTATINFEQAELNVQRCKLIAPADGVILKEYLSSRTTIAAGDPIYSFRDYSESWITEVELTDQNAFAFGLGTKAVARFAPYPGEEFPGELTKQAGVADDRDGLYRVEVTIATKGKELRPGMVVEIDLSHQTEERYSTVPLDALVDVRGNVGIIYLVDASGSKVDEQFVHMVAITQGFVALAEPIPPGQQVVIRGQQSLRDDSPVRIL